MTPGTTQGASEPGRFPPVGTRARTWWLAPAIVAAGLVLVAATTRTAAEDRALHGKDPGRSVAGATACPRADGAWQLPPGHPPVAVPGLPPGHPPVDLDRALPRAPRLPAGHPPVDLGGGTAEFEPGFLTDA